MRRVKESRGKKEECRIKIKEGTDKVRYRRGEMKNRDTGIKKKRKGTDWQRKLMGGRKKYEERKTDQEIERKGKEEMKDS